MKLISMDSTVLTLELMSNVNNCCDRDSVVRVDQALRFSAILHVNDFRRSPRLNKQKMPYIEHVLRVALRLIRYVGVTDENVIIAALLHDTVEDHSRDFFDNKYDEQESQVKLLEYYTDNFGNDVAYIVSHVTNPIMNKNLTKNEKRKLYFDHVSNSISLDHRILLVKFSDFVDNAGSLHLTNKKENEDTMTKHLLAKYTPLIRVFTEQAENLLNGQQKEYVMKRLYQLSLDLDTLRA